jgi:hypothetical protein
MKKKKANPGQVEPVVIRGRNAFFNGMTWPLTHGLEWTLRHGEPKKEDLLHCVSIVGAYTALIQKTQKDREKVVRALKHHIV